MNLKSFQDWLDRNFSEPMQPAPTNELQLIYARIDRERRVDAPSLLLCLASVALTVIIILATRSQATTVTTAVTKESKNDLLHADEDLDRDFDVSLEHFNKIVNSSRQM